MFYKRVLFTWSLCWTCFASFAPSSSHGTTTHHTSLGLRHGIWTLSFRVAHVTKFFTHINALLCKWWHLVDLNWNYRSFFFYKLNVSLPPGSRTYPSGQTQLYPPSVLTQVPTPQMVGSLAHSSISIIKKNKQIVWHFSLHPVLTELIIPKHIALALSIWYPSLQVHMKLPKVLEQRPFLHKLSISLHSSISSKTT